jgi:hypothetical protein
MHPERDHSATFYQNLLRFQGIATDVPGQIGLNPLQSLRFRTSAVGDWQLSTRHHGPASAQPRRYQGEISRQGGCDIAHFLDYVSVLPSFNAPFKKTLHIPQCQNLR